MLVIGISASAQVSFQAESVEGCAPFGVVINVTQPATGISSYSWTITTPTGTTLTASSAQYVSIFNTPGTYDVSLTINGSQTQAIQDYITVHAKPSASFTMNDPTGCYPHCVQFTQTSTPGSGAITTFHWDFGNGSTGNTANPEQCYSTAGSFTPILSVTDENGCFSNFISSTVVHISDQFPHAAFTSSSFASCSSPATFEFQNSSTGNNALSSHWTFGNGEELSTSSSVVSQTYSDLGTYPVCLTVTDTEGCSDSECHDVQIMSQPQPSFTVSASTICAGQGVTFNSTTSPVPNSFLWDLDGNGTIDAQTESPAWIFSTPGTYHPSLTVSYGSGCTGSVSGDPIVVLGSLSASLTATETSGCEAPFTTTITANVSGSGTFSYNWIIQGQSVGNTQSITHTFENNGSYNVAVSITSTSGCSAALSQSNFITVQSPAVSFEIPQTLCFGEVLTPENFTISGGAEVSQYAWDFDGDGSTDSEDAEPSYVYSSAGEYFPVLTVTTSNGCVSSFSPEQPVEVIPALLPTFSSSQTISCAGEAIEFCIPEITGATYSWNFHDQSGWITMAPEQTCIEHMYEDTGYFDLSLSIVNGECNLTDTLFQYIYIEPPVALFDFSVDCNDMLTVTVGDQSIGAEGLSWDFGDGSAPVEDVTNYTHTYAGFGDYEIILTATSSTMMCPDTKSHTVHLAPPSSELLFANTSGCGPLPVQIGSGAWNDGWEISISNGYHISVEYLNDSEMFEVVYHHDNVVDTAYAPYGSSFWPEIQFWYEGCYDFEINAVNAYGCPSSASHEDAVCVISSFDFAAFHATPLELCDSVHYEFTPLADNITSAEWTFSDGGSSNVIAPDHVFEPPYDYDAGLSATLSAVNALGCTSVVTQPITAELPAIPSFFFPEGPFCQGAPVSFTNTSEGNFVVSTWNFGDPGSGENNTSQETHPVHSFSANGLYNVCLTVESAGGCSRTYCTPHPVQVSNPEVSFTVTSSVNNCLIGAQFENTTPGNNTTFTWSFGDNQTGTGASTYHTYPLGVFDVTLSVVNEYGCSGSVTVPDIFDYSAVIGPFDTALDETACAPFDVSLSAFNPDDTSFSYFWDFNDGNGDPTGNTQVMHQYTAPGTYCPQLIMTDLQGCQVLVSCENPIVVENLELVFEQPQSICEGESVGVQLLNAEDYSWSGTGVSNGNTTGEFILTPSQTTDYVVTGTLDDCVATATVHVEVYPLPEVSLSIPGYVCFNTPAFPLSGGVPEGGEYVVNGFPGMVFSPSMPAGISYPVLYSYTDANGCTATAEQSVMIRELPVVSLPQPGEVCENSGMIQLVGGFPAGGEYRVNDAVQSHYDSSMGAGIYPLSYTFTDAFGCSDSALKQLIIHALPQVSVSTPNVCHNVLFEVENSTTCPDGAITSSFWQIEDGPVSLDFQPAPFFFDTPGEKHLSATFTSEFGCAASLETNITVHHAPVAAFTLEDGCEDSDLTFTSQSSVASGEIVSWEWIFQGQAFADDDTIHYAFHDWGTLPASLIVFTGQGCSDTLQQHVTVHPTPEIVLSTPDACVGEVAHFTPQIELLIGEIQHYEWDFSVGAVEPSTPVAEYVFDMPGNYVITLNATSSLGCTGTAQSTVHVYGNPEIDFVLSSNAFCSGDFIQAIDISSVATPSHIQEWSWYVGGELVSTEQHAGFYFTDEGHYDLRLVATTNHGCSTDSLSPLAVLIHPRPDAGFILREDEVYMISPTIQFENTSSEDVTQWWYQFGDGNLSSYPDGQHTYDMWGNYMITQIVTNTFGCKDTAFRSVDVSQQLLVYIPNAFTPDGNGNNDVFKPSLHGSEVLEYEFMIYDRWGKIVFLTTDTEGCWDGSVNGTPAQDGIYNWTMKIRSKDQPVLDVQQGVVTLLR